MADLDPQEYAQRMSNAANTTAGFKLRLVDPQQIKLLERKRADIVDNSVAEQQIPDREAQCELLIQQLLDQAFVMNSQAIKDYVLKTLKSGAKLSTKDLPIDNADDLLAMAHAIEVGGINNLSSELRFSVKRKGSATASNEFYERFDEHEIELIENHREAT